MRTSSVISNLFSRNRSSIPEAADLLINRNFLAYPLPDENLEELTIPNGPNNWEKIAWKAQDALEYETYIAKRHAKLFTFSNLVKNWRQLLQVLFSQYWFEVLKETIYNLSLNFSCNFLVSYYNNVINTAQCINATTI